MRYLAFNDLLDIERGMRAEPDKPTPLSVLYRNRDMVQGLVGGKCRALRHAAVPAPALLREPAVQCARQPGRVQPSPRRRGQVLSYTADALTYCPIRRTYFGMVQFDGGGRMMMDFSEIDAAKIDVGLPMRMMFRIKDDDPLRGFVRYFWKAIPS